jgi:NTE family protein
MFPYLRFSVFLFLICSLFLQPQAIPAPVNFEYSQRPKVGLVLSGGGALGMAHIGVLKVLEQLHVPVDCVVGTSMGALVGGTWATGVSPLQMEKVITETDLDSLFDDRPPRSEIPQQIKKDNYRPLFDFTLGYNDGVQLPSGASAGYKFELFLKDLIGTGASISSLDFDELPTPYRATATDLETGELQIFSKGELPRIMRASMSLPGVIAPTEIGGRVYVDGGLVRNLPVDIARNLCGDVIIAVNLGTGPKPKEKIKSSIDVAIQSIVLLTEQNVQLSLEQLTSDDILIVPDLEGFDSSSFSSQREIIERGVRAALDKEKMLAMLAVAPDEYQAWLSSRQSRVPPAIHVQSITVDTTGAANAEAVERDIKTEPEAGFDTRQLNRDISHIFGRGDFSYVGYSVVPDNDNANIVITAESKPWGPGYLKFGLGAATDFTSPSRLNLAASYRRTWINSLGAEWRTDMQIGYDSILRTAFIQPMQVSDGAFVTPYLEASRTFYQYYQEDIRLGEFRVNRFQIGIDLGVTGSLGEFRVGPFASQIKGEPDFGIATPLLDSQDAKQTGIIVHGVIDQLDRPVFPRSGLYTSIDVASVTDEEDGTVEDFTKAQAKLTGVTSLGENTVSVSLEWGDELSGVDDLPVYEVFELGGPRRLSGLYLEQLTGTRYNLATASYYYQYASLPSQLGSGMYLGLSLEAGRINDSLNTNTAAYDWIKAGSIFWGADTILGSAYIGYGYSSINQSAFYLVIGPDF